MYIVASFQFMLNLIILFRSRHWPSNYTIIKSSNKLKDSLILNAAYSKYSVIRDMCVLLSGKFTCFYHRIYYAELFRFTIQTIDK